jgi:hypothetical protein
MPSGLKVVNTIDNGQLVVSLNGQPFRLNAISDREFWNKRFGFFFFFDKEGKKLTIEEGGNMYELIRQ